MLPFFLSLIEDEYKTKFEYIYYEFREIMASVANSMTKNRESAEDALSLAFLSIAENIRTIKTDDKNRLRGYLITVVKNVCINKFNKDSKNNPNSEGISEEELCFEDIDLNLENKELCETIIKKILIMHESYRYPLYLHYIHGHTAKEIAKMTEENENTVKSRIRRGTLLLREILSERR